MDRRTVLAVAGAALVAPRMLLAQPAKRIFRIATLDDSVEGSRAQLWQLFRGRLRELVLNDGNDVAYEARYARGEAKALQALAAELVAHKPDLIVCAGSPATGAAKNATSSVPIVFLAAGDPVGAGLVASLARPGGNLTGTSIHTPDFAGKYLELMRELVPAAQRFAYLNDASSKAVLQTFRELEKHARELKLTIRMFDGRQRSELEKSFAQIKQGRFQGMIVGASGTLLEHRNEIAQFVARKKIPAMFARPEHMEVGGLLAFSADMQFGYRRGAEFAHRILNGAKPADLPVEQSSNTRLVLNLKTARALGIAIPATIRVRADEVIE